MSQVLRFPEDSPQIREACDHARVVFTNGCFDGMHPGHLHLLMTCVQRAEKMFGIVAVGVNSDASTGRLKGLGRPIFSESHRAELISVMRGVELVVIFDQDTPAELMELIDPMVVVKGAEYDQETGEPCVVVAPPGVEVFLVSRLPGHSTTGLIISIRGE